LDCVNTESWARGQKMLKNKVVALLVTCKCKVMRNSESITRPR